MFFPRMDQPTRPGAQALGRLARAWVVLGMATAWAWAGRTAQDQIDVLNACAAGLRDVSAASRSLETPGASAGDPSALEVRLLADGARQVLFGLEKLLVIEMEARDPDQMRWLPSARKVMVEDLAAYCRHGRRTVAERLGAAGDARVKALLRQTAQVLEDLDQALRDPGFRRRIPLGSSPAGTP
jgi:hypothetical protein